MKLFVGCTAWDDLLCKGDEADFVFKLNIIRFMGDLSCKQWSLSLSLFLSLSLSLSLSPSLFLIAVEQRKVLTRAAITFLNPLNLQKRTP